MSDLSIGSELGVVKSLSALDGVGFIEDENGKKIFVHKSSIKCGNQRPNLLEGQRVTFDLEQTREGPSAINVMYL